MAATALCCEMLCVLPALTNVLNGLSQQLLNIFHFLIVTAAVGWRADALMGMGM